MRGLQITAEDVDALPTSSATAPSAAHPSPETTQTNSSIACAPASLFDGYRGAPVIDRAEVRDVLVRIGALVDDLPDVAELEIDPLIGRVDGLYAVEARIRVAEPSRHPNPLVRQLRGPRGEG